MGLDYYEIIHVNRDVSDEELKKAYRKLALRWHPDKNPTNKQEAEVRFEQISEAYEVLIDPLRTSIYNEYGEEGLKGHIASSPQPGQNGRDRAHYRPRSATDIFAEFFGLQNFDFGPMWHSSSVRFPSYNGDGGGGGNTSSPGGSQQNHPIYGSFDRGVRSDGTQNNQHLKAVTVENKLLCSLEELYTGSTRKMKVSRRGIDSSTGEMRTETEILVITVKPGWKAGTKVTFPGMGADKANQVTPDLVFVIDEKPHGLYKRDTNDLVAELTIPLADALGGTTIKLRALDGRDIVDFESLSEHA